MPWEWKVPEGQVQCNECGGEGVEFVELDYSGTRYSEGFWPSETRGPECKRCEGFGYHDNTENV